MILNERPEMVREVLKVMRIHMNSCILRCGCFVFHSVFPFPHNQVFKVIDATEEISAVRELLET